MMHDLVGIKLFNQRKV